MAKLAIAVRAGKKLTREEQAAAFEACARRLRDWEELSGSVLQTMNIISVRGMDQLRKLSGAEPEPSSDAPAGGRAPVRAPDAPLPASEGDQPKSFLLKRGESAGAAPKASTPTTYVDASGTIGSPTSREEMAAARAARLARLEQNQKDAKDQSKEAEKKAKAREAMFETPLNWRGGGPFSGPAGGGSGR